MTPRTSLASVTVSTGTITALMLWVGVGAGRRGIPVYHLYFGLLQPRFGDALEDEQVTHARGALTLPLPPAGRSA